MPDTNCTASASNKKRPGISIAISAFNEERTITSAISSVRDFASEIIVVDCSSDDNTAALARESAARVITAPNHLMLNINKNLAIAHCSHEWILVLDADERVSPTLARELEQIALSQTEYSGYWMPRRNHELGRWIRHMGLYPDMQLRFFRNGAGQFECQNIHEMVAITGRTAILKGPLDHFPRQSVYEYVHKRNLYSEHRANHFFANQRPFLLRNMLLRPLHAFGKQYLLRSGWREGVPGFIIGVSGAYGTFLQEAKLWQRWHGGTTHDSAEDREAQVSSPPYIDISKESKNAQ